MNMAPQQLSKLVLLLLPFYLAVLNFSFIPVTALNVGIQARPGLNLTVCSPTCQSQFCNVRTPFFRYGRYCGFLYGCARELNVEPCGDLDACCKKHDECIGDKNDDYLSTQCSNDLLACVARFRASGGKSFEGSTCSAGEVANVITDVIKAALLFGSIRDGARGGSRGGRPPRV